jgi:hypothetical protein
MVDALSLHKITDVVDAMNGDEDVPTEVENPISGEPGFRIFWRNTGGYRGHYDSEALDPERWERVKEGNVCGEWDDVPPGTRTSENEAAINAIAETRDVVLIFLPTSNVFSMAYDLWGRKGEG